MEEGLDRFIEAQNQWNLYDIALEEMHNGKKRSHWIWYIFPQLVGLGHSYNSNYYGIKDLNEAMSYMAHPILGTRLREITNAVMEHKGEDIRSIMGSIDAMKLCSSMTLFDAVCTDDVFASCLVTFFKGKRDRRTMSLISINNNHK
jgi:uncharacterized protein (DUF1810 family)